MSTLSVKVYTVAGGRTPALTCGPNFNCPDPRDEFYLQNIVGKTMESLVFSGDGCRYTLYKINGGRGDASEACVFIPKNINAAQSPLMQIVSTLRSFIESGSVSEGMKTEMERMCTIQCPEMRNIVPAYGSQTAAINYGESVGVSLTDILYDVFRPEFAGYRTIFLSDDPEVKYPTQYIPTRSLYSRNIIVVRQPANNTKGFIPTIDGDPFIHEQYMFEGTPFIVEWTKKYWHPITKKMVASSSLSSTDYVPMGKEYKRTKNNPLYITFGVIGAVIILVLAGIITANVMNNKKIKESQESRLQSMVEQLDFSINMDEFGNVDNRTAWENAINKAKDLENTYQFKVRKPNGVYTPEDVEAFCRVVNAATYLDQHDVWEKSEMEKLDSLKGFFDYVNSYDIVLAQKKGESFIQRFRSIPNVEKLLELTPMPGLSGKASSVGRISLSEYMIKVEGSARGESLVDDIQQKPVEKSKTERRSQKTEDNNDNYNSIKIG